MAPSQAFHRHLYNYRVPPNIPKEKGFPQPALFPPLEALLVIPVLHYNRGPRNVVRVYCTDRLPECKFEVKKRKNKCSDEHAEASPHRFGAACGVGSRRIEDFMNKNAGNESRYREALQGKTQC
jgi:hypothetical protein